MADNEFDTREQSGQNCSQNCFSDTVCIDAERVYDSCGDKDCLEDLTVYFAPSTQNIIDKASNVRLRDVSVITVLLDLEPVPFHKGFYSVDMTFFFDVCLDVFMQPAAMPVTVSGLSVFSKKVILYGSEGNVKVFSSNFKLEDFDKQNMPARNLPKATVQVAEPIGLSAKLCEKKCPCPPPCRIPECICKKYGGDFGEEYSHEDKDKCHGNKEVLVTIGIFTIVQIERNVQMMIPVYDFCIPDKECTSSSDNPCELFSRIDFPTDEFFPPRSTELDDGCGCGKKRD